MSKLYRSREGSATAVDTKTQLSTLGSETAPGPLLVPAGAKSLAAVICAAGLNLAAVNDTALFIRLEGPGLPEGPETITISGGGVQVATGGSYIQTAQRYALDIPVVPGNEILIFAEMAGEDIGGATVGVTLEFQM